MSIWGRLAPLATAGLDPSNTCKAEKAKRECQREAKALTAGKPGPFEHVTRDWLANLHEAKVTTGHAGRARIRLEKDVFPMARPDDGGKATRTKFPAAPAAAR